VQCTRFELRWFCCNARDILFKGKESLIWPKEALSCMQDGILQLLFSSVWVWLGWPDIVIFQSMAHNWMIIFWENTKLAISFHWWRKRSCKPRPQLTATRQKLQQMPPRYHPPRWHRDKCIRCDNIIVDWPHASAMSSMYVGLTSNLHWAIQMV
jgi:hypothetical protein